MLTYRQASRMVGVSEPTFYKMIKEEVFDLYEIPQRKKPMISEKQVLRYLSLKKEMKTLT